MKRAHREALVAEGRSDTERDAQEARRRAAVAARHAAEVGEEVRESAAKVVAIAEVARLRQEQAWQIGLAVLVMSVGGLAGVGSLAVGIGAQYRRTLTSAVP